MGIGAPGLGGGPNQPPSIRETETQGINETTKKFVLGLVSNNLDAIIPFTKREYDELFKYKSEPDRPSIAP